MYNHNDGKVIKYEKIAKDRNLVTLATAYDHNCSRQQTVEVSDAVLAVMLRYLMCVIYERSFQTGRSDTYSMSARIRYRPDCTGEGSS